MTSCSKLAQFGEARPVVEAADGQERRRATVRFDGAEAWWIDDGSVVELRASDERVLLEDHQGLVLHDRGAYVHGWVRTPLEPWRMSLDEARGVVLDRTPLSGRICTTADVDGLRAGEDVTFRIWVDEETGIAVRIERLDGTASINVQDLRLGILER